MVAAGDCSPTCCPDEDCDCGDCESCVGEYG